jgi:hypothetical protein
MPIKMPDVSTRSEGHGSVTRLMSTDNVDDQWVDVSFWVAPDGRTTDVDVLRASPSFSGLWAKPIIESVKGRRYAPLKMDRSDPGILRVERYTFTSRWTTVTGSRMRVREAEPRIEMLDLSTDEKTDAKVE